MGNFFTDNDDLRFVLNNMDLRGLSSLTEQGYKFADKFDYAPASAEEAIQNYNMVMESLGQLCSDFIAPRSEEMDRQGNTLTEDGRVERPEAMDEILDKLAKADVMGMTLPYRFGGLNFPTTILSVANEMISRADASLMNIFGLQGIAETINSFASEEIKQEYLHDLAAGRKTGAMVLTEPDAGSDLQVCKVKAFQDSSGQWYLHGVKRFITNGCGEVLLVMARSEHDRKDGLGLSLFVCHSGPTVKIRRIEDKMGIHASPTCEIYFDNTPCKLIGETRRGLVTYVMALMNGARIGISAQSVGIGEAAYRVARDYAASREQFGGPIEHLPAVRDMVVEMKIDVEESRALLYETCRVVDMEIGLTRITESDDFSKEEQKDAKKQLRMIKRYAAMLTPMSKYLSTEMSNKVAYDSIQVLAGSGFMRDYPTEQYYRDARITTIYEGTTQLQIVACVRGVCNGTAQKYIEELADFQFDPELQEMLDILKQNRETMDECIKHIKQQSMEYMDLYGRRIVDIAIKIICGYLFCRQASGAADMEIPTAKEGETVSMKKRKAVIAKRYINRNAAVIKALAEQILQGDKSTFEDYEEIAGPVPELV
ncbi:Acyl-CoA dehydrogenase [Sedimentisphaera cyanobacteriorum]|uniref:Acyl-CoA dehydrogenase n=1 Tax=Sedimentisphaera cyanobacteriorum TaxID=1940790 RepID=A0A1Q2HRU9_9BACT|nr:acyl-CoA dehydrogenase family protein [Sedimentisphaera cyanobacteriorum]AQQ10152.1 Acyl-CoA dehydrogenase [Sedimentisphaera cyanobacteriorum]